MVISINVNVLVNVDVNRNVNMYYINMVISVERYSIEEYHTV